ncbi:MAG: FKBP-type peptidyl-prolyl cis-trans isomerase [Bacteroidales bacterium]|nr:FKBP-type peptidyl-prolyl cis-trans isomerase [Bacteroidales bacterium]
MKLLTLTTGILLGTIILASCQQNIGEVALQNELDSASYCIGVSIGSNIKNSPMKEINYDAMIRGFREVMEDIDPEIDSYQANQIISSYMQRLEMAVAEENLIKGRDFLNKNGMRNGVITTESGLQYEIIKEGYGPKPSLSDQVNVHYHGTLLDGTVFDSSLDKAPVTFEVGRVIKGWQEAMQLMPVGSKWTIWVPGELGYGIRPMPGGKIGPNDLLIFEVELFDIVKAEPNQQ